MYLVASALEAFPTFVSRLSGTRFHGWRVDVCVVPAQDPRNLLIDLLGVACLVPGGSLAIIFLASSYFSLGVSEMNSSADLSES